MYDNDMPTQVQPRGKQISVPVFYATMALVALLAVALIVTVVSFQNKHQKVTEELAAAQKATDELRNQLVEAVKQVNDQIVTLDARDGEQVAGTKKVKDALAETDANLSDYKTAQEARLSELLKSLEEIQVALRTTGKELDSKLQATKAELGTKNQETEGRVDELKKDKEFLVTELAKKAEKAYVNFVEKKLNKQIGEVSGKLEEVDGKIVDTQNRIDKLGSDMNKAIKDQVDEHVKLDFQPSNAPKPEPTPEGGETP